MLRPGIWALGEAELQPIPAKGCHDGDNKAQGQKRRRPVCPAIAQRAKAKGFRAQAGLAWWFLGRRPAWGMIPRRTRPDRLGHKNSILPNFQKGSQRLFQNSYLRRNQPSLASCRLPDLQVEGLCQLDTRRSLLGAQKGASQFLAGFSWRWCGKSRCQRPLRQKVSKQSKASSPCRLQY